MLRDLVDLMEDNQRSIGKAMGPRVMGLTPDTAGIIDEDPEDLTPEDFLGEGQGGS